MDEKNMSFSGQLLIASPGMDDPRFKNAVIYLCAHDSVHAMGIVINKSKGDLSLSDLMDQIGIEGKLCVADTPLLEGGPVDIVRGFVLHSLDYAPTDSTHIISSTLGLTATKDALEALVTPQAPQKAVMAMGYAGWTRGQLEAEIKDNVWLVAQANDDIIFDSNLDDKWEKALAVLGINAAHLCAVGGTA